jgi:HSP20 family molecular chaperone IbpA
MKEHCRTSELGGYYFHDIISGLNTSLGSPLKPLNTLSFNGVDGIVNPPDFYTLKSKPEYLKSETLITKVNNMSSFSQNHKVALYNNEYSYDLKKDSEAPTSIKLEAPGFSKDKLAVAYDEENSVITIKGVAGGFDGKTLLNLQLVLNKKFPPLKKLEGTLENGIFSLSFILSDPKPSRDILKWK